ncbi:MAG: OmpA family protein [Gemmatimonadota bacterium]|nr:OmpA family protein [Gemmatimonadota bacterium]
MTDISPPDSPPEGQVPHQGTRDDAAADQLARIREILVGREREDIDRLRDRLERLGFGAEEVSQVLPEAVTRSARRDERLGMALSPTLETAIRRSVRRDPRAIADAIFPALGPAIRKAISEAMSGVIHALNTAIEHSVSWRGLKWRVEAMRSGVPFAQVVLRHTLVYAVEQAFLIHRDTGLVLCHAAADPSVGQDADVVSGMLTAIRDFVADSFGEEGGGDLRTFSVGQRTVKVEQGPHAFVAVVIRGHAPNELHTVLNEAVESVHMEFLELLQEFDGETAPFEAAHPILENCLQMQVAEKKGKGGLLSPALVTALLIVLALLSLWAFFAIRTNRRWARLTDRLQAEPGLVLVDADRRRGDFYLSGLRDPLARDPASLIDESKLDVGDVRATWEGYLSFDPGIVAERTRRVLNPPNTVSFVMRDGALHAVGLAPEAWITVARRAALTVPGVSSFVDDSLASVELQGLRQLARQVERHRVLFGVGSAVLEASQDSVVSAVARQLEEMRDLTLVADAGVRVELLGRSDTSGSEAANRALSALRAGNLQRALVARGIPVSWFVTTGLADDDPVPAASADLARLNRSVSIRVTVSTQTAGSREP